MGRLPERILHGVSQKKVFLLFIGNFGVKIFKVFENGLKLVLPDGTGIYHVKNHTFTH